MSVLLAVLATADLLAGPARALSPDASAANEEGGRLFRAGAFLEAVAQFDRAYALDPGFEQARRNLATALTAQGQEELQAGTLDAARSHLERAADLAPTDAATQLLLGILHFRRGDFFAARLKIDRALELQPELAEAREVSGDLYYQEGALDRARAEWELALAGPGSPREPLRAKIDRAGREINAEGGFGREVSRHFTVQFDEPVPRVVARTALLLLEEAYERLWRDFGKSPQHDLLVILYSRTLFDEITRSPDWVSGTYDGKIRIPVGGLQTESDARRLAPVLAHELVHAFIRANVPGPLPLWFEEGLATHFGGTSPGVTPGALRSSGRFTSLEAVSAALRGGQRVAAAYAAAALAVAELIRIDGVWLPSRILDRMAAGASFAAALRELSGLEFAEFEARWVAAQR